MWSDVKAVTMKPNFALTLSFDGIGLLHRAFPGWHLVGDVALDCADLSAELTTLRQKALMLDASGLRCKLVLPNDQVKYLSIRDFDGDISDMDASVRSALEEATPYGVDDLAYDWSFDNGVLSIAAVARETLAEAEAFAVDHQFNPVCYVATPDADQYVGEPYFGVSAWAKIDAGGDIEVTRDSSPIRVIGAAKLPDPEAAVEVEVTPEQPAADADDSEAASAQVPEPEQTAAPEATPAEQSTVEPGTKAPEPEQATKTDPQETPEPHIAGDTLEPAAAAAFASIRARREDGAATAPRLDGVVRDAPPPRITFEAAPDPSAEDEAPTANGVSDPALPIDEDAPIAAPILADQIRPQTEGLTDTPALDEAAPFDAETHDTPEDTAPPLATPPPADAKPAFFTRRSRTKKKKGALAAGIPQPADEKQRMTIFGAREQATVGGKPRFLGLILTAVLLLFLIVVAAWASIFMDDGLAGFFRSNDTPAVASLPSPEEAEAALSEEEEIELASLTPDEAVSVLDDPATEILSRVTPADLSPDEAKARYAATGIWQLAPEPSASPQPNNLEEFYQTSLDPDPGFQDAVALPSVEAALTDGIMFSPAPPPAADTRFVFDPRGFVLATPKGAITPEGVIVFAGQPKITPPASWSNPETALQQPEVSAQVEIQQASIRPRARPADAAEQIERNALSGRTINELASLRPKMRPESAQEAAEEARKIAQAKALAAQQAEAAAAAAAANTTDPDAIDNAVAAAAQATIAFSGATPQAVKSSVKPKTKPRNFDKIVQRTKRKQTQSGNADTTQQAVAVRATQRVSPKIPSKASVSKQATQRNAIKFKRVNLIGVYGTPKSRRALVRMSNGRYKKVKVGDRLDGGKVSAIGDSDLRYNKGGRSVVLKMPRG